MPRRRSWYRQTVMKRANYADILAKRDSEKETTAAEAGVVYAGQVKKRRRRLTKRKNSALLVSGKHGGASRGTTMAKRRRRMSAAQRRAALKNLRKAQHGVRVRADRPRSVGAVGVIRRKRPLRSVAVGVVRVEPARPRVVVGVTRERCTSVVVMGAACALCMRPRSAAVVVVIRGDVTTRGLTVGRDG